ncbi:MAG: hypothetical protein L0Z62_21585 [Gemmataceae bacterium]|nr:hypothetical protein [Gemmataceae bacterium]
MADLVKDNCVAVALNGHMLHWLMKTDGEDGAFIKANRHPSGGNCFVVTTPSGKKLAGGNGSGGAREALAKGLAKWKELPEEERKALPAGQKFTPPEAARCTPPPVGLVVTCYLRNLKLDDKGEPARITHADLKDRKAYPDWNPIYTEPAYHHLWLTEAEWKSLIPAQATKGNRARVPDGIEKRILRYHLLNGTFGLPGAWRLEDIRKGELTLTVEGTEPVLRMRLEGLALLANDADVTNAKRGYDVRLSGWVEYDPARGRITRFDVVALGDYWGGDYEGGRFKRPGKTPLGIAFELARGDSAVELAPPLVHMDRREVHERYFAAERK